MTRTTLATARAAKALAKFYTAAEALEEAAMGLVREEVALMSLRYPSRRLTYFSGNGARGLEITRRKPIKYGPYNERNVFGFQEWGLEATTRKAAAIMPAFFAALSSLETESGVPWLGCDCVTFQNGREVE